MFHRRLLTFIAGASWAAVCALAQSSTTTTRDYHLPPFGLASTETARINLTNVATASSSGTAASCTGSVSFVSASGATIGASTSFTIASGQTSSGSLPFGSSGLSAPRGEIRAVVQVTRSSSSPTPCSLLISLETFDTSGGVTHLFLSGSESFGGPQGGFGRP